MPPPDEVDGVKRTPEFEPSRAYALSEAGARGEACALGGASEGEVALTLASAKVTPFFFLGRPTRRAGVGAEPSPLGATGSSPSLTVGVGVRAESSLLDVAVVEGSLMLSTR